MKRFPVGLCLNEREQQELTTLLGHYQHELESEITALTELLDLEGFVRNPADRAQGKRHEVARLDNARRRWATAEKWVARFNPSKKGKA